MFVILMVTDIHVGVWFCLGVGGGVIGLFIVYVYLRSFFYIQIWCENKFILLKELMNVNLHKGNQNVQNESKQKKALRNFNI